MEVNGEVEETRMPSMEGQLVRNQEWWCAELTSRLQGTRRGAALRDAQLVARLEPDMDSQPEEGHSGWTDEHRERWRYGHWWFSCTRVEVMVDDLVLGSAQLCGIVEGHLAEDEPFRDAWREEYPWVDLARTAVQEAAQRLARLQEVTLDFYPSTNGSAPS